MATLQDIVLNVPEISCEHCIKAINGALGMLPGVEAVSTDIPTKRVHLRYDAGQLSREQIEMTLDEVGYTVSAESTHTPPASGKPLNLF